MYRSDPIPSGLAHFDDRGGDSRELDYILVSLIDGGSRVVQNYIFILQLKRSLAALRLHRRIRHPILRELGDASLESRLCFRHVRVHHGVVVDVTLAEGKPPLHRLRLFEFPNRFYHLLRLRLHGVHHHKP
nr:hypothetical protein Iba_scaffold43298CG1010 [Ipomoea batatas]